MRLPHVLTFIGLGILGCGPGGDSSPGPAPSGSSGARPIVGVSLLTKTHEFYQEMQKAMEEAAAKAGLDLRVQSGENDVQRQTSQVDTFLVQKAAAIVLCPASTEAISGAIRKANEKKVPVFTADIRGSGGDIVCHVASDNVQGGRLIGKYLADAIGGKGEVAIIDFPEVTSVIDRVKGFREAIAAYPGIKEVAAQSAQGQRDKAQQVMQTILKGHPDLNGVFGINDDSALGALSALQSAGKTDVKVVGFDATTEARKAIQSGGPLIGDAAQDPRQIGRVVIETVAKHLKGESVPKEIPIPTFVVDKSSK